MENFMACVHVSAARVPHVLLPSPISVLKILKDVISPAVKQQPVPQIPHNKALPWSSALTRLLQCDQWSNKQIHATCFTSSRAFAAHWNWSSQVSTSIQYPSPASRCWAHFGPAAPRCTRNLVVWPGNVRPSWTVFSMSFPWPMVQINQCYFLVLQRDFIWSNWLQYIMHLHEYVHIICIDNVITICSKKLSSKSHTSPQGLLSKDRTLICGAMDDNQCQPYWVIHLYWSRRNKTVQKKL